MGTRKLTKNDPEEPTTVLIGLTGIAFFRAVFITGFTRRSPNSRTGGGGSFGKVSSKLFLDSRREPKLASLLPSGALTCERLKAGQTFSSSCRFIQRQKVWRKRCIEHEQMRCSEISGATLLAAFAPSKPLTSPFKVLSWPWCS